MRTAVSRFSQATAKSQRRWYNAAYGMQLRSHDAVTSAFVSEVDFQSLRCKDGAEFVQRAMPALEGIEDRLLKWKLAKWEFRVPSLLSPEERESARRQVASIRQKFVDRLMDVKRNKEDLELVANIAGGLSVDELQWKTREWVQERVAELRWKGDLENAKALREAWIRLEQRGGPQRDLLERLCYVYALARLGTFDEAFSNTIVPQTPTSSVEKPSKSSKAAIFQSLKSCRGTDEAAIDETNPLRELMKLTLVNLPTVPILHDFLGLNTGSVLAADSRHGYRDSLGRYLGLSLQQQLSSKPDLGADDSESIVNRDGHRIPRAFGKIAESTTTESLVRVQGKNSTGSRVALFDFRVSAKAPKFPAPVCDFMIARGPEVTLITIASHNKFVRETQIVSGRQATGIARRAAMLLGTNLEQGKTRCLLLPPHFIDNRNLRRLNRILGINGDLAEGDETSVPVDCRGWVSHYDKELAKEDEDYAAQSSKTSEEEWFRL